MFNTCLPRQSYAVFEIKQKLSERSLRDASRKVASVRRLARTTSAMQTADGEIAAKAPHHIVGGLLAFAFDRPDDTRTSLEGLMTKVPEVERLDLGCAIRDGAFGVEYLDSDGTSVSISPEDSSLVTFFFQLLAQLQRIGTVPAMDYGAYLRSVEES